MKHADVCLASMLTVLVYFGIVFVQSLSLRRVTAPHLAQVLTCGLLRLTLSLLCAWGAQHFHKRRAVSLEADVPETGMDKPDRFVKFKSESSASYFYYLFFLGILMLRFVHTLPALLFHSIIGAFFLDDIVHCLFQSIYYKKTY